MSEEQRPELFARLIEWIAEADSRGEPFRGWPRVSEKFFGWDAAVNVVLKRRSLRDFGVPSDDCVKGVDLFMIAIQPRSRRLGRAIAIVELLLRNVERSESLQFFAVAEVESEELRAGLRKYLPSLREADEGRFFFSVRPSVTVLPPIPGREPLLLGGTPRKLFE